MEWREIVREGQKKEREIGEKDRLRDRHREDEIEKEREIDRE